MGALPIVIGAQAMLAFVLMRWTSEEYDTNGVLSRAAATTTTALVAMHALTVAIAAGGEVWQFGLPVALAIGLGIVLVAFGLVLLAGALRSMDSLDRITGQVSDRLVVEGAYGRLRHPQVLGWGLVLAGIAVSGRSWLAVALVGAYALAVAAFLRVEEEHLRRTYGEAHERYRSAIPALPGLKSRGRRPTTG